MFIRHIGLATGIVVLMTIHSTGSSAIVGQGTSEDSEACCFSNPAYSGVCKVQPTKGETCASILAYLNNPMAHGKDYCGGTPIREGWRQVDCNEESE
jgi:hypothetical protein